MKTHRRRHTERLPSDFFILHGFFREFNMLYIVYWYSFRIFIGLHAKAMNTRGNAAVFCKSRNLYASVLSRFMARFILANFFAIYTVKTASYIAKAAFSERFFYTASPRGSYGAFSDSFWQG